MDLRAKLKEMSQKTIKKMDRIDLLMKNPNLSISELSDLRAEMSREIGYLRCINDLMLETI